MGRFNFIGSSYRSQSPLADCQTLINWYEEQIESGVGRSAKALYPCPGLNQLYNLGGQGTRGGVTFQGRTFVVAGQHLYELYAPNIVPNFKDWSATLGLNLPSDGTPVSIAYGGHHLLIVSVGQAYYFDLNTNTLAAVDASAGALSPILQVRYADGFFFALAATAAPAAYQIFSSNLLDASTWQATNFTSVSVFPDNPNGIFVNARLLWVFGPNGIQPYSNTGDFPFPFDVIPGTYVENGLAAPFSIVKIDNSFVWLGSDERGNGMVWRANGFTPQRISDHALEFALQSYPTISDAIAYSYQDQGHSFYVLTLPTANKTWVYDAATQKWHQRAFYNAQKGAYDRHRSAFHTFNFGLHLVGDYSTGAVYQMAINIGNDFGNAIVRERTAPHICKELEWIYIARVQADVEVGLQTLQGNAPETTFAIADAHGGLWTVQISDVGAVEITAGATEAPASLFLTDPATNTSWQLVPIPIDATHATLQPVAVAYVDSYPAVLAMVSSSGKTQWNLTVKQITPAIAQLVTTALGIVGRGPQWTLYWSKDGGQTFSQGQTRESGQLGQYLTRVLWNRLGRARDWVFRLRYSDPAPARVIDFYAQGEDDPPTERMVQQVSRSA